MRLRLIVSRARWMWFVMVFAACGSPGVDPDGVGGNGDCEAAPAACEDADGDGVSAYDGPSSVYLCDEWRTVPMAEDCTDCDDTDAEVQLWAYLDADGDGSAAGQDGECLPSPLPANYTTDVHYYADCNDSDPSVQTTRYYDGDGDGYSAAEAEPVCFARYEVTPDYVHSNSWPDCDDDDPLLNPAMPEQTGDEIDSNCDGDTEPVGCVGGDDAEEYCYCHAEPATGASRSWRSSSTAAAS